jgi:1-acyl-sn-glycerol-3-phosphate acyltransferase
MSPDPQEVPVSDLFYDAVRALGYPAFWLSSSPLTIDTHHVRREGGFILAATHASPYDIPLLIRHVKRRLDFVSIVEVFRNPFVAWFYGSMNAFPLDRSRRDEKTVRIILDRLRRGRVVAMFPEGGFRRGEDSVVHTRRIRPGIGRLARLANVPVVPCVIVNSQAYSKVVSWLPLFRTRYGIIFGCAIEPTREPHQIEQRLIDAFVSLHGALVGRMPSIAT